MPGFAMKGYGKRGKATSYKHIGSSGAGSISAEVSGTDHPVSALNAVAHSAGGSFFSFCLPSFGRTG